MSLVDFSSGFGISILKRLYTHWGNIAAGHYVGSLGNHANGNPTLGQRRPKHLERLGWTADDGVWSHGLLSSPMKKTVISIAFLAASASAQGQVDRVCRAYCTVLSVQGGTVRFIEQSPDAPRNIPLGRYVRVDRRFVPAVEAPIRNLRSQRGWRIVMSAFLHHDAENEGEPGTRIHFFDPSGAAQGTDDALMSIEQTEIGRLFGGNDEIFAITTKEEHAYNTQTKIFLLPETGRPKLLLAVGSDFQAFSNGTSNGAPGVTIARQTYDGVHSETKGTIPEFYTWNRETKFLELQQR